MRGPERFQRRRWFCCVAVCLIPGVAGVPGAAAQPAAPTMPPAPAAVPAEIPVEPAVSLQEAIQVAHQNHGRVAVAEESVEAARQRVRQARTGTLPSLTGRIGYNGRGTSSLHGIFGGEPETRFPVAGGGTRRGIIDTDSSTFDQGLQPRFTFTFTPFDGGLTRASVRQARAGVEGSMASLTGIRNDLAFEVSANYLAQLRAERLLELRLEQERLAAEQLRSVEARIAAGDAAESDRALPLSELRNRQVDRIQAENDVRVAANSLRNSMGLQPGPSLQLIDQQESRETLSPIETYTELARRRRPEVVQAEAQVRVAQQSVSIARIGRLPRFDTSFTFNVTPNNAFSRSDYSFGAAISMPLWDAGLSESQEQEARSGVQSATAQLEQAKKDVTAETVEAYLNLVNARERLDASRLAVEAARVNLEATTARYQRGIGGITIIDLIQAQVQFSTASNNAINSLYDIHLAEAALNRAIGR